MRSPVRGESGTRSWWASDPIDLADHPAYSARKPIAHRVIPLPPPYEPPLKKAKFFKGLEVRDDRVAALASKLRELRGGEALGGYLRAGWSRAE